MKLYCLECSSQVIYIYGEDLGNSNGMFFKSSNLFFIGDKEYARWSAYIYLVWINLEYCLKPLLVIMCALNFGMKRWSRKFLFIYDREIQNMLSATLEWSGICKHFYILMLEKAQNIDRAFGFAWNSDCHKVLLALIVSMNFWGGYELFSMVCEVCGGSS